MNGDQAWGLEELRVLQSTLDDYIRPRRFDSHPGRPDTLEILRRDRVDRDMKEHYDSDFSGFYYGPPRSIAYTGSSMLSFGGSTFHRLTCEITMVHELFHALLARSEAGHSSWPLSSYCSHSPTSSVSNANGMNMSFT